MTLRIGRIPYINCYPVYGAIDRGLIRIDADLVDGVPTALNAMIAAGKLDVSVVSAVEYARESRRYLLLPDLAISCDGPVRSVMLFSKRPATELSGRRVLVEQKLDDQCSPARASFRERLARTSDIRAGRCRDQ